MYKNFFKRIIDFTIVFIALLTARKAKPQGIYTDGLFSAARGAIAD
jgi:hypothetical protein